MAAKKKAATTKAPAAVELKARVVGKAQTIDLTTVKPNAWNMNEMTEFQTESLRKGFLEDGWLASEALLVWGTDTKGKKKNVIIDGEHRWTTARALGINHGPAVFLENLSEAAAKALTIKMNHKRGTSNKERLALLVKELSGSLDLGVEELSLSLGIEEGNVMLLLAEEPLVLPGDEGDVVGGPEGPTELPSGKQSHMTMVQLFFDAPTHEEFNKLIQTAAKKTGGASVSDVVMGVLRAHSAS